MLINLEKGQKIELTKGSNITRFYVGLGWKAPTTQGGHEYDLDVSAILVGQDDKILDGKGENFVFYNNLKDPQGAVTHTGDNRTGDADGDDEQLHIDVAKLPANCKEVQIIVTIHDAATRSQNFGAIRDSYIRVAPLNDDGTPGSGDPQIRYDLDEDYSAFTALQMGAIYRDKQGEWKFDAIGQGFKADLRGVLQQFGAPVS